MKITFFDTESTDLSASWGRILCASFAELEGPTRTYRIDKRPTKGSTIVDDSKLVVKIRDELEDADMICGWNSILHDVPLLNARLAVAGERGVQPKKHLDLMYYSGGQAMKIGSRKLVNVSAYFKTANRKTPLDGELWQLAGAGDKKALNEVVVHCEADVLVLRELFPHLAPYVKKYVLPMSAWWKFASEIEV